MRRIIVLTTLALAASTFLLLPPAAGMRPVEPTPARDKAKLACPLGLVGVDAQRRVRYDSIMNGRVTDSTRSKARLGFGVTAWGLFDSRTKNKARTLTLNAVAGNGVPRQVRISFSQKGKITGLSSSKLAQSGFTPRLFADGYGYHAYVVERGTLNRYSLFRYPDGTLKYSGKVKIGKGYGALTSLQVTTYSRVKGVLKEILYATTTEGALLQIQVPIKRPSKEKVRTLATTGYSGVTEMSWSLCNDDPEHIVLAAVDPVAEVATWTTVKNALGKPKATLRGEITGDADWAISAAY